MQRQPVDVAFHLAHTVLLSERNFLGISAYLHLLLFFIVISLRLLIISSVVIFPNQFLKLRHLPDVVEVVVVLNVCHVPVAILECLLKISDGFLLLVHPGIKTSRLIEVAFIRPFPGKRLIHQLNGLLLVSDGLIGIINPGVLILFFKFNGLMVVLLCHVVLSRQLVDVGANDVKEITVRQ